MKIGAEKERKEEDGLRIRFMKTLRSADPDLSCFPSATPNSTLKGVYQSSGIFVDGEIVDLKMGFERLRKRGNDPVRGDGRTVRAVLKYYVRFSGHLS